MEKIYRRNPFVKIWSIVTTMNALALVVSALWTILFPSSIMREFVLVCMVISIAGTLISSYYLNLNIKANKAQRELLYFLEKDNI